MEENNMEFDFSIYQKQNAYNEVLRNKYTRLVAEERALVGGSGRRITQKKIAKQVGISDSLISKWLDNNRELSLGTIEKMAEVLLLEENLLEMKKQYRVK